MQIGAIIEQGPQNWQILQQENGKADIRLSGKWVEIDSVIEARVYARVVSEDTGENIIPWTECDDLEKHGWKVILKDVPAGGLYRIETCLNNESCNWEMQWAIRGDMIHHVGVGDVYVIAGQSNSAGYGKDPIYDPAEMGIHLLRNNGRWDLASHPLNESTDIIHKENRESANPGHSPYLCFAKQLKKDLGYPIGLIQTALGGSPLSRWNPDEEGTLYGNMMRIIKSQGGAVKGILWYQGCSDTVNGLYETYLDRFANMVKHMRKDLNNEALPILTVQLNRLVAPADDMANKGYGMVREAQRQASKSIPNVFIIPANDCTLSDAIHISSSANMILGERLARAALEEIYHKGNRFYRAPDLEKVIRLDNDSILLTFKNIYRRLFIMDSDVKGLPFTIVDDKGKVGITGFEVKEQSKLMLTLDRPLEGQAFIHGAFEQNPEFFLPKDEATHLPMLSFYGVAIDAEVNR